MAVARDVAVLAADDEDDRLFVERIRHLARRRRLDVEQAARGDLARLALDLDLDAPAVDEVQLVLRVVEVVGALVLGRVDGRVDAERRDAERRADLPEAGAVAELVEGRERVRHVCASSSAGARRRRLRERQPPEQRRELGALLLGERRAEELLDVGEVRLLGRLELHDAGVGQDGVGHARVGLAARLVDPAGALEPVEQPRDAGRRQEHRPREVDAAHAPVRGVVELDEDVEVAERQPVLRLEPGRELARHRRVGTQEPRPGREPGLGQRLCGQYLTRQSFSGNIVDIASIYANRTRRQ